MRRKREPLRCFDCDGPHLVRNCPERKRQPIECYECKGDHLRRDCPELKSNKENRHNRGVNGCVSDVPLKTVGRAALKVPVISVLVNNRQAKALVDTGCTTTMVHERFSEGLSGEAVVSAFDGRKVRCKGTTKK